MWILTPIGFFSIVDKKERGNLTIRARVRNDLVRLRKQYIPNLSNIVTTDNSDYRFRAYASRSEVADALAQMAVDINYDNFKDEVKQQQGQERARIYMRVWSALLELQPLSHSKRRLGSFFSGMEDDR